MKKEGLILTILLGFSLVISAQTENLQRIESINQKLYLIEDDGNYPILDYVFSLSSRDEKINSKNQKITTHTGVPYL